MLNFLLAIGILFGAFGLLALLFGPPSLPKRSDTTATTTDAEDAASAQTIGTLTGLLGGDIAAAAKAQFALRALKEQTGREPTTFETGVAVGMSVSQSATRLEGEK